MYTSKNKKVNFLGEELYGMTHFDKQNQEHSTLNSERGSQMYLIK